MGVQRLFPLEYAVSFAIVLQLNLLLEKLLVSLHVFLSRREDFNTAGAFLIVCSADYPRSDCQMRSLERPNVRRLPNALYDNSSKSIQCFARKIQRLGPC
jgi:hypothetical protein